MEISIQSIPIFIKKVEVEGGAGKPVLVFLHDALGSVAQWKDFPEKMAQACGLNAVVFDRQGHGQSAPFSQKRKKNYLHVEAWEVLPKLLEALEIDRPLLVGHSDGGTIALLYAAHFQPVAIVTLAAHVLVEEVTLQGIRQAVSQKEILLEKLKKYHGDKTEALFSVWSDTWLADGFRDWNIEAELPKITCPALLIQGENDEYATPKHLEKIVNGIGEFGQQKLLKNCGHFPHKQALKSVLVEVTEFIQTKISTT